MDSDLGKESLPCKSAKEIFDEVFPYYLCLGMSEAEYWDGDSALVIAYRKADKLRQQRTNQEHWLLGAYIYDAFCRVSPVMQAFAKKGTKPEPYLSEPFVLDDAQERMQQEDKAIREMERSRQRLERFAADTNKHLEGK